MRNFSLALQSLIVGGVLSALLIVAAPITAHAQTPTGASNPVSTTPVTQSDTTALVCQNNPNCLSFDPDKNPFLTAKNLKLAAGQDPKKPVVDTAAGTSCLTYIEKAFGGAAVSGCVKNGVFTIDGTVMGGGGATGETTTGALTQNSAGETGYTPTTAGGAGAGCTLDNPNTWGDCLMDAVARFVLGFANFMLGIAGVLLNWVVVKTVFQFSQLIGNSAGLLTAWGILRDIGNLLLLFGFVLMGIGTILDTNKLPDKKAIPMLIIFAILLNFSIFAAEAIIDTSNVLTSVLYSQATNDPCWTETCNVNNGIAGHIMESTGLSSIYAIDPATVGEGLKKFVVLMGLSLFSLVGTVVLFAAALMLAFRAITLTGLIIVSPIGFAGMAIKPLQKMANQWWTTLIHQAFFAPILFLLIFVSLKVTEGFSGTASNNHNLAQALTGTGTSNMGIIMVFILITGALVASLMAAKSFGAMGADYAIKTAGGFAFGTGAFIGRRTLGAGAGAISRNIKNSNFGATKTGKLFAGIADRGAAASFDTRTALPKKLGTGKNALDLGKPGKTAAGGYAAIEKKGIEDRTKYAASLTLNKEAKAKEEALKDEKKGTLADFKTEKKRKETERAAEVRDASEKNQAFATRINDLERVAGDPAAERTRLQQQIDAAIKRQGELTTSGSMAEAFEMNAPLAALREQLANVDKVSETLESVKAEQAAEAARAKGRRDSIIAAQNEINKREKTEIDRIDKAIQMNSPKGIYADRLERSFLNYLPIGVAGANRKAAEKIKGEFKKTKIENALSSVEKTIKDKDSADTVDFKDVVEAVKEIEEENGADDKDGK